MSSLNSEEIPVPSQMSNPEPFHHEKSSEDEAAIIDLNLCQFEDKMNNDGDSLSKSKSVILHTANENGYLEKDTTGINRNQFSEMLLNDSTALTNDLECPVSSSEENSKIFFQHLVYQPFSPNNNEDILSESAAALNAKTETVSVCCYPNESLGLILGMNEVITDSKGEIRKVYVKKISTNGALNRLMNISNRIKLGDKILAINGTYMETLTRTECVNLLIGLPNEVTLLLQRNDLPWTTGPHCAFYLNLADKNVKSILSPAPQLFLNEGNEIPDGYKLFKFSLYKDTSDLLGICIVPSYGDTKHYYQIKDLEPNGIGFKSKLLKKGDLLVSCNGNSLFKIPFNQCLNILKSEESSLTFEVFRKDDNQNVFESSKLLPINDDTGEVNLNVHKDNDDGLDKNSFTTEFLKSTEVETLKPVSESEIQINFFDQTNLPNNDSNLTADIQESLESSKSHSSSFESEVQNTLNKPLLDFLTGSPFVESTDNTFLEKLQKPLEACPPNPTADNKQITEQIKRSSPINWQSDLTFSVKSQQEALKPNLVEEPCIEVTSEAVQNSQASDWSSQLNMSNQSLAKDSFSLDSLEELSNTIINNELNNNLNIVYPSSSNEDLISIDADILSPIITDPNQIFSNNAELWEAAGESKSENLLSDLQMPLSVSQKNVFNNIIDAEPHNYGFDSIGRLHQEDIQINKGQKHLMAEPSSFYQDAIKYQNFTSSENINLKRHSDKEDDYLYGSTEILMANEVGDIPLSSRNSDPDLIDDLQNLSPDSGRADSPGISKDSPLLSSVCIPDDYDKITDEDNTIYHTISDVSKSDKRPEKYGSFDSSSDSCGTSVGSFESCADIGEQDGLGVINSKTFNSKNKEGLTNQTKSLPRNAFSNFKEFNSSMIKPPNEKSSTVRTDTRLFSFNEISTSKIDSTSSKYDLLNKFSTGLFSRNYKMERKSDEMRSDDKPFQVEVLKGIIGLGMTLKVDEQGFVKVTHIQNNSPIGRNGIIKIGDYILSINNTDMVEMNDFRVQQILRLLPRGLIKVVASAIPLLDWKRYTQDSEESCDHNLKAGIATVSLTSPIKMSDNSRHNSSGYGLTKISPKKPVALSFSSENNILSKEKKTAKILVPTISPNHDLLNQDQCTKNRNDIKTFSAVNNPKPNSQSEKNQNKNDSFFKEKSEHSPKIVLNQVQMFENFSQQNNPSLEVIEPVASPKQKLVETFDFENQKESPLKNGNETLLDIHQDQRTHLKKQYASEKKNGSTKTLTKTLDSCNEQTSIENGNSNEEMIVPVKSTRYQTFSALPRSSTPRILDSFSIWDNMDLIAMENKNKDQSLKKKMEKQVSSELRNEIKEEFIIPTKKASVQSLVNHFNTSVKRASSPTDYDPPRARRPSLANKKEVVVEETIEPIKKAHVNSSFKPLPINFSEDFDIDEVLIIEKTEKDDVKPNLKMTLTGPYYASVEVSEPPLKPEKKKTVKFGKSMAAASPQKSEKDHKSLKAKRSQPEECYDMPAGRDIVKKNEVLSTEMGIQFQEENIVPHIKPNQFKSYRKSHGKKEAKFLSLLSSMDDDTDYDKKFLSSPKQQTNDKTVLSDMSFTQMNPTKPSTEDVIVPVVRKSKRLYAQKNIHNQQIIHSNKDSSFQFCAENGSKCSLDVLEKNADVIVKDIIKAAQEELVNINVSEVKNSKCDRTEHQPKNDPTDQTIMASVDTELKNYVLNDPLKQKIDISELSAPTRTQKPPVPKRNLPLIENGKPKPLPRQSQQLSPSYVKTRNIFQEKPKTEHQNLTFDPNLISNVQLSSPNTDNGFSNLNSSEAAQKSPSPSDMNSGLKSSVYPEVSPVESHTTQSGRSKFDNNEKLPSSLTNSSSPENLEEKKATILVKSSKTLIPGVENESKGESEFMTPPGSPTLILNIDSTKNEVPKFTEDCFGTVSSHSKDPTTKESIENISLFGVGQLPETKVEKAINSSDLKDESLNKSTSQSEQCETSPSDARRLPDVETETLSSISQSPQMHFEIRPNNKSPTSSVPPSPSRIGSRKLPNIFTTTSTFKSVSSPSKTKTDYKASISIEENNLEHKSQKIKEVSNADVVRSEFIGVKPKMALQLTDPKLNPHNKEIVNNVPQREVNIDKSISLEPKKEVVKTIQPEVPVKEISKPELTVESIGDMKKTSTDLQDQNIKCQEKAVKEEKVSLSQSVSIKPTNAPDLPLIIDETKNKFEFSKSEKTQMADEPCLKEQGQKVEVVAEVSSWKSKVVGPRSPKTEMAISKSPKTEVAVSKFIGLQPTIATELSKPLKTLQAEEETENESEKKVSVSKAKSVSRNQPNSRPALLRYKSTEASLQQVRPSFRDSKNGRDDNRSAVQSERSALRRFEKVRPKSEIISKGLPSIFSKRKWCISTESGQTNFALPSDPDSIEKVIQLGLIHEDQLDQLLTSANLALDKMSFPNTEEIHVAILEKTPTEKIGMRLKKGDKQQLAISLLEPDGAAIKQKHIHIGDSLILLNGKAAWNQTVMDVKVWLQTIETRIIFVLSRHSMDDEEAATDCEFLDIILQKGVTGIGFCLEGGVGYPLGDRPISIKRIFKGGPAEKSGQLKVGDEILKVNDMDFRNQRHFDAWNHLKFLPEGPVKLQICRRKSHTTGSKAAEQLQMVSNDSEMST